MRLLNRSKANIQNHLHASECILITFIKQVVYKLNTLIKKIKQVVEKLNMLFKNYICCLKIKQNLNKLLQKLNKLFKN